jgi:hypothetical protein
LLVDQYLTNGVEVTFFGNAREAYLANVIIRESG